jgi:translation initiation factor 2 beta subunit (eIF-2beta)/eIF-5
MKMIVPIVQKDGSKKTRFVNVVDICKRYVNATNWIGIIVNAKFLVCTEHQNMRYSIYSQSFGTSGTSTDGQQHLIIKEKFVQKQIENVLKTYIRNYLLRRIMLVLSYR